MSRKNKNHSLKKQKGKNRRKTKRHLKKMEHVAENFESANAGNTNVVAEDYQQIVIKSPRKRKNFFQADQSPSTSRRCKKNLLPRNNFKQSPWKKAGGKVNRFKKIIDDQARKLVRRSVHIVKDNKTHRKVTPKKTSSQKKIKKRLINLNKSNTNKKKIVRRISKDFHSITSLEEGEIRSDNEKSFAKSTTDTSKTYMDDDDDDCIVIEPSLDEITIDDEDDIPSTSSGVSTNYQSLVNSFKDCISSTPFNKNSEAFKTSEKYFNNDGADETIPFFIDVERKSVIESNNNYTKLSTLREGSNQKRRGVRLKETTRDEIIELDTGCSNSNDSTLKRKSRDTVDDSVIFISETNKNDFIPILSDDIPPHKLLKINVADAKTPVNRLCTNNLFTRSETKKLNEYNENAYNPSTNALLTTGKRMVIIDGSNVAFKHGLDQVFSVKGLKIAIDYFEKMGHEVKAVIPQFRMNKTKSTDYEELERLHKAGKIVQTPCKNLPGFTSISYDDRFILQLGFEMDAAIVSNDNYRDLLHENPAFKKIIENRVIGYTWCNDIFILPKDPYGKWGPKLHTILNRS